jgi:hypothetical protein
MAQAFYTLEESAQILQISADELKQMARKQQIRAFQDRGTWRFRVQDIQELARQRGMGSDPELIIGKPATPQPPAAGPRTPASKGRDAEVFDFSLDLDEEHVGIGHEDLRSGSHPSKRKSGLSPAPKAGSDSDVRLVTDSELEALSKKKKGSDSEVKLVHQDPPSSRSKMGPKSSKVNVGGPLSGGPRSPKPGQPPSSKPGQPPSSKSPHSPRPVQPGSSRREAMDSGVRLVPMGSDSDVKIVGTSSDDIGLGHQPPLSATDSDIRLQQSGKMPPPDSGEGMLTEEIDLDHELQQGGSGPHTPSSKMRQKPLSSQDLTSTSPFQLADDAPAAAPHTPPRGLSGDKSSLTDSSGDFELTPSAESSSPVEPSSSDEFSLEVTDDADIGIGDMPTPNEGDPASGINLVHPADGGISLEEGAGDAVDFELGLDEVHQHTPKPASSPSHKDSEFELSLDADSDAGTADSSEFELTLDDSGGLAPLEEEPAAGEDKDIFETDFEVPALDDESGSQALALDESAEGELESSDFDLTLGGDEEGAVDEESGSQVVALEDEGEVSELGEEEPAFDQFEAEGEEEPVEEEEPAVYEKALPTAPWGALPVIFMLPCVIVLFLVSVMGFELVQSVAGHKPPGMLTKAIGGMLGQNLKQ